MERLIEVAIGIVVREGWVLVCQRPMDTTLPGLWEFPGGKREEGESLEACAIRELREEVAIDVRTLEMLEPIEHVYPSGRIRLHPFLCELIDGDPQAIGCQRFEWITPPALRDYAFPPANDRLIEEVIERLSPRSK